MQIQPIKWMIEIPPGNDQFTQRLNTLKKKQRQLKHYPKTIAEMQTFKSAYPLVERYQSPLASKESLCSGAQSFTFKFISKKTPGDHLIILIPGGLFCYDQHHDFDHFAEKLAKDGYQVVIPKLPHAPQVIYPAIHDYVHEFVQQLLQKNHISFSSMSLIGYSSGAHIALQLYHRLAHEQRLAHLILINGLYQMNLLSQESPHGPESLSSTLSCYFVDTQYNLNINALWHTEKITKPTLIVTGSDNDNANESLQLATILGFQSHTIDLLLAPGAFHDFLLYDYSTSNEVTRRVLAWLHEQQSEST